MTNDNVFQRNIFVELMKREGRESKMSCSIDYEIEKKTVLMFAWCIIRTLEAFLGAFFQHHEVLERNGWGGGGKTIGMRFPESWRCAASLLYWKVAQANLIAWCCEEIEARLRWVSAEERTWGCTGNLMKWQRGSSDFQHNRVFPSLQPFSHQEHPNNKNHRSRFL